MFTVDQILSKMMARENRVVDVRRKIKFLSLLVIAGCSNPTASFNFQNRLKSPPNVTLEVYLNANRGICPTNSSQRKIIKSDKVDIQANNNNAKILLHEGLCFAVNGEVELATLYMYRTVHFSDLVPTDGEAKRVALSYLSGTSGYSNNVIDYAWSNKVMLADKVSMYGWPKNETLRHSQESNHGNLRVFYGKSYQWGKDEEE